MNEPFQLYSIGFACQQLQLPIAKVRVAADRLGIVASSINGVVHFSESDVELIRAALLSSSPCVLDQRSNIS